MASRGRGWPGLIDQRRAPAPSEVKSFSGMRHWLWHVVIFFAFFLCTIKSQCAFQVQYLNETSGRISVGSKEYTGGIECNWIISPVNSTQVDLIFSEFELEAPAPCCSGDTVEIFECVDIACGNLRKLVRISGSISEVPPLIVSKTGIMLLNFKTDLFWSKKGFEARYSVPCEAGSYGHNKPDCQKCTTSCPDDKTLKLTSCGAVGSTIDNECVCRPGQHTIDNNDRCVPCPLECDTGERLMLLFLVHSSLTPIPDSASKLIRNSMSYQDSDIGTFTLVKTNAVRESWPTTRA